MTKKAAEFIAEFNGEVMEDYSGRGMYGKQTAGVVVDTFQDFFNAIADVMGECINDGNKDDGQSVIDALRNLQSDNMGKGYIFY